MEASESSDDVIRQERQVLHNILDLSEITVEEVMRPRGSYVTQMPPVHLSDLQGEVPLGDYLALPSDSSEEIEKVIPLADFSDIPQRNLEETAEYVVHVPWCSNLAQTLQLLRDKFASAVHAKTHPTPVNYAQFPAQLPVLTVSYSTLPVGGHPCA